MALVIGRAGQSLVNPMHRLIDRLFQLAACLFLAFTSCGFPESGAPGAKIYTFAVGVFDASGNFTASDVMPYERGSLFGYQLSVHSTSGKVRVREVLDLPEAAVRSENARVPAGINVLEHGATQDGKRHVEEFEIECGDKMATFGQVYEIVDGDPSGTYKFTIYIDGQLAEEAEFQVQKMDRRQKSI